MVAIFDPRHGSSAPAVAIAVEVVIVTLVAVIASCRIGSSSPFAVAAVGLKRLVALYSVGLVSATGALSGRWRKA